MKKSEVRGFILDYQNNLINNLMQSANQFADNADLDEEAVKDKEDFSFQDESGNMARRMKEQLKAAKLDLSILENISEDDCDEVKPGALVLTDKNNFYIGIPSVPFEVDGKKVMGISSHAPIFHKMNHKKVGDNFEMANITYKILSIS